MFCTKCGAMKQSGDTQCETCGTAPIGRQPIQFAYVCQKDFYELQGDGDAKRFCTTCRLDVINLDPLDDAARLKLFTEAAETNKQICVSVTQQPLENTQKCPNTSRVAPVVGRMVQPGQFPPGFKPLSIPEQKRPAPDEEYLKKIEEQFGKKSDDGSFFAKFRSLFSSRQ